MEAGLAGINAGMTSDFSGQSVQNAEEETFQMELKVRHLRTILKSKQSKADEEQKCKYTQIYVNVFILHAGIHYRPWASKYFLY